MRCGLRGGFRLALLSWQPPISDGVVFLSPVLAKALLGELLFGAVVADRPIDI